MEKATVADMMRFRAKELRTSSLDGNSKMSAGQCANILMEYVKLLEIPVMPILQPLSQIQPPYIVGDQPDREIKVGDFPAPLPVYCDTTVTVTN